MSALGRVGEWGAVVFLVGAGVALFKTIIANVPSLGRQVANTLSVFGAFDWTDMHTRDRWMRIIMVILPITWGTLAVLVQSPLALVIIAGILIGQNDSRVVPVLLRVVDVSPEVMLSPWPSALESCAVTTPAAAGYPGRRPPGT